MHQPEAIVRKKIALYERFGIETQCGGPVLEIARLQGVEDQVLDYLKELGFEGLEVSSESLPSQTDIEADRVFAEKCKKLGFIIHGEVGKKFPEGDTARSTPDKLNVETAAETFKAYIDMGCEGTYLEGHLLRAICGEMGENTAGWDSIQQLVERVGLDDIIFEIPGTFSPYAGKRALQGQLVYYFGPDVNWANILIEEMPEAEEIRAGTFPGFGVPNGDHPWIRSLALNEGRKVHPEWWRQSV